MTDLGYPVIGPEVDIVLREVQMCPTSGPA